MGKKANKVEVLEQGFLNHPVHKLVCTGRAAEQGGAGTLGRGDLIAVSASKRRGFGFGLGVRSPVFRQRRSVV